MSEKMKNIPKLRFPEFVNDGEWEDVPLSKVGEIITGNTPATANLENYGGMELFVSPADISDKRYITTTKTTLSKQGFNQTRHIKANSILFVCIGSTIGKIAQNKVDCATNQQINSIVPFDGYCNDFVYSVLENNSSNIALMAGNHAVPIINKTLFSSVIIKCPLLPEQQKIADCLSSVDSLISAQSKKVELLKEHKKGLLQNLFPRECESIPRLRFPEFANNREWEEKILDDVVTRYDNLRVPVSAINRIAGKTPYYGANGIQGYVSGYTHDGEFILIAEDGANDLIDYPIQYVNGKIWVNNHAHVLQAKKNIAYNRFLKFAISKINIEPFLVGGGRAKLNANIMMKLKIKIPKPKEQQKIADCLSSLDEQISQQTNKLQTLKEHKKALMQQLFPSAKES